MDVTAWLQGLGLGEHAGSFAANRVTAEVLPSLTDEDVKALGVTALGDRRRLLSGIKALQNPGRGPSLRGEGLAALVEEWPSVLAFPLREYVEEAHPVLKLWHACDVVELTLRFMVMVGVAEAAEGGELPEDLARELWDRIEQPTLGRWRGMAEALARARTAAPPLVPELRSHLSEVLVPLLDGPTKPRTAETSFSQLRNHLAHGAGVTRATAARLLALWQPRFEDALGRVSCLGELSLVVRDATGGFGELRGPTAKPASPRQPTTDALAAAMTRADTILLARGERVLTLWPLALYGEPRAADRAPMGIGESPQVYTRRGEVQLEYTPLGLDGACQAVGEETALDAFKRVFRLEKKRAETTAAGFTVRGFEGEVKRDSERLVGRHAEIETLGRLARGTDEGVVWVSGRPGIGKSYVVSRVASELLDEAVEGRLVLPYRFKIGDDRCSRESFLRFAIERMEAWAGEGANRRVEGERQREKGRPLDRLKELLEALQRGRRVVFVLDGLDEIAERDRDFATEVPLGLRGRGVLWLCAGRPERGLPEAFGKAGAIEPFPGGLPRMSEGDIRTMLLEKIGPLRKRLLRGDRDEGDRVVNPFVERVAKNAEGLPIYVKYVVGDVLEGKVSPDPGAPLPPSLAKYHEELLRRCSVGILQQVLTPLTMTLAAAKEPLGEHALAVLLRAGNVVPEEGDGVALVRRGLSSLASMLRRSTTPDGKNGYTLYHHSLRQHIESSAEQSPALATARANLCNCASKLRNWHAVEAPYLLRWGPEHLAERGRWHELADWAAVLLDADEPVAQDAGVEALAVLQSHWEGARLASDVVDRLDTRLRFLLPDSLPAPIRSAVETFAGFDCEAKEVHSDGLRQTLDGLERLIRFLGGLAAAEIAGRSDLDSRHLELLRGATERPALGHLLLLFREVYLRPEKRRPRLVELTALTPRSMRQIDELAWSLVAVRNRSVHHGVTTPADLSAATAATIRSTGWELSLLLLGLSRIDFIDRDRGEVRGVDGSSWQLKEVVAKRRNGDGLALWPFMLALEGPDHRIEHLFLETRRGVPVWPGRNVELSLLEPGPKVEIATLITSLRAVPVSGFGVRILDRCGPEGPAGTRKARKDT